MNRTERLLLILLLLVCAFGVDYWLGWGLDLVELYPLIYLILSLIVGVCAGVILVGIWTSDNS